MWDHPEQGIYFLEWYEDGKRRRPRAGIRPADVLERQGRKILETERQRVALTSESSGQGHLWLEFLHQYETTIKTTKLLPTGSKRLQFRPAASAHVFEITELDAFNSHLPPHPFNHLATTKSAEISF